MVFLILFFVWYLEKIEKDEIGEFLSKVEREEKFFEFIINIENDYMFIKNEELNVK